MTRRSLLVLAALLMSCIATFSANAQSAGGTVWQVQSYDLNVTLPQADNVRFATIKAALAIKNVSASPASTLTLRISPQAEVTGISVSGSTAEFTKGEEKTGGTNTLQRIGLRLPSVASGASVNVAVDYKLTVKDNSGVSALSSVGSQLLPLSFWYPTPTSWFYSRGGDTAPFKVRVTAPSGLSVVSAGTDSGGSFDAKTSGQPFILSGNWDVTNRGGVSVAVPKGTDAEGLKRADELAALFSKAKTFAGGYFGIASDIPLKIVAVRRGGGFSGGGVVLVDQNVFRRPKIDAQTAMNVAEAAARLWLGGEVTVNGDGFGAISEGLTRFIATQFIESEFGKDAAEAERMRQRSSYIATAKRGLTLGNVSPLDDAYYGEVAGKGAMMWRILERRLGQTEFTKAIRSAAEDRSITIAELRLNLAAQKDIVDYFLDKPTDMNLLVGLPVAGNGDTKAALRNTGSVDLTVNVRATTASGKTIDAPATIRAASFGEVAFKTPEKIARVEIDSEKLYPQLEYFDDVQPREFTESDPLLAIKKPFDMQTFPAAETAARAVLKVYPHLDEARVFLGRALLGQGRTDEAEREFRGVFDERLPTARSLAWANVGLGEVAAKANRNSEAIKFAETAISYDADYGASYAARKLRTRLNGTTSIDPSIKAYFASFDQAATANRKADVDALVMGGEVTRFASGVAGSTEKWQTQVTQVDSVGQDQVLVEAALTEKLLNKNEETGVAVYRLQRVGTAWKLIAVEIFEVG